MRDRVRDLLGEVAAGAVDIEHALERLSDAPVDNLDFATIDHHRSLRQGFPEVIYAPGKTAEQVVTIAQHIAERGDGVLVTRADLAVRDSLRARFPSAEVNELGRIIWIAPERERPRTAAGPVLIVTAGTSDLPVAEEAAVSATAMGNEVRRLTDVGVAGIHRLLSQTEQLRAAKVVIVVAGMDGALPSVVAGLVRIPVIAVPTSVGYGASFGGVAALLAMLNSCAAGLTVVNIDNGFGAAVAASRITHA
jgi:hypothetical protein